MKNETNKFQRNFLIKQQNEFFLKTSNMKLNKYSSKNFGDSGGDPRSGGNKPFLQAVIKTFVFSYHLKTV